MSIDAVDFFYLSMPRVEDIGDGSQDALVVRVSADGVEVLGEIHSDSTVLRTVRIGDVLYAVSDDHVTAYSLTDFSEIGRTPLGAGQEPGPVPLLL